MRKLRPGLASRRVGSFLLAALAVSSCGGDPAADSRGLSEAGYLAVVKRDCLAAKRAAEQAAQTSAVPAVYLKRVAEAAEAIQRGAARVRPPTRFAATHRESARLGDEQLRLIRAAIGRLQSGEAPQAITELQVRNRRLQRRANEIADQLGIPECHSEAGGP